MPTEHLVLTRSPLLSLAQWQAALDAERYPLRLVSIEGSTDSAGTVRAELSGGVTAFTIRRLAPSEVIGAQHQREVTTVWHHAIGFRDVGTGHSAFAATLAACAYAPRAWGVLYDPDDEDGFITDVERLRAGLRDLIGFELHRLGLAPDPSHPYVPGHGARSETWTIASCLA